MALAIARRSRSRGSRPRVGSAGMPRLATPIKASGGIKSGSTITFNFDQPVLLDGVPKYLTNLAGVNPVSAVRSTTTQVIVTYSAAVGTATSVTIPFEDPAVRNASGGFVNAGTVSPVSPP